MNDRLLEAGSDFGISDHELVVRFQAAREQADKTLRDELGRLVMDRVLVRIDRTDLREMPLPDPKRVGYTGPDGQPATVLDYLSVAIDHGHGRDGMSADAAILNFLDTPATNAKYSKYVGAMRSYVNRFMNET